MIDLEPGDLLFVPAQTPHVVTNLPSLDGPTVALSQNFLAPNNLQCAADQLALASLRNPPIRGILGTIFADDFDPTWSLSETLEDASWTEFKSGVKA